MKVSSSHEKRGSSELMNGAMSGFNFLTASVKLLEFIMSKYLFIMRINLMVAVLLGGGGRPAALLLIHSAS